MKKAVNESPNESPNEAKEIPTVKIAVEEFQQMAIKAEIYDAIVTVNQGNARIAQLEQQLRK